MSRRGLRPERERERGTVGGGMPGFPRGRYGWYGSVAARAYIARTNPNGNSSLRGASPIMHTLVLHTPSAAPGVNLHPKPPSSIYIYIYISLPSYHLATSRLRTLLLGVAPYSTPKETPVVPGTKLPRNSIANRCRCAANTSPPRDFHYPLRVTTR